MYHISYSLEEGTNLYLVRCLAFNQTIVLSRGFLVSKIGMDPRTIVGCKEVSLCEIIDLSFIPPVEKQGAKRAV